ncbi:hypothetical protein T08_12681 [Trichinella sp. T8]|nr:hypothetical protein T08_12681 [Trichinella sp. T8]
MIIFKVHFSELCNVSVDALGDDLPASPIPIDTVDELDLQFRMMELPLIKTGVLAIGGPVGRHDSFHVLLCFFFLCNGRDFGLLQQFFVFVQIQSNVADGAIVEVTRRGKSEMCVTVLQTVYMLGLLVAVGFTMGGMLLPMWVESSDDGIGYAVGLFLNCTKLGDEVDFNHCRKIWDDLTLAEQLGAGAMFLSCATCAVAFAWSCIAYYGICCRRCMTQPLPYVTALAFVLDLTGIICIAHDREIGQIEDLTSDKELGLSIWLCVAGVAVLLFDTLVASGLALSSILCPC